MVNLTLAGIEMMRTYFRIRRRDAQLFRYPWERPEHFRSDIDGKNNIFIEKKLHSGDILTMEGKFQDNLVHRVPVERKVKDSRLNFTWRWIKNHGHTSRKRDVNPTRVSVINGLT